MPDPRIWGTLCGVKRALLLILSLACHPLRAGEKPAPTDFIRVHRDEKMSQLQTSVTTYKKEGVSVTLFGAVHLADKGYYQDLSRRFITFDRILYEMIGGENAAAIKENPTPSPLATAYKMVGTFLNLADQKTEIDYSAENFIHADLTAAEFKHLQEKREESILSFALAAAENADVAGQPATDELLATLMSGNSDRAKLLLMKSLAAGDEVVGGLADQSVMITDRNAKCLEVLSAEIAKGHQNLGIFYGAAHCPGLEAALLDQGFQKTGQSWIPAWSVPDA